MACARCSSVLSLARSPNALRQSLHIAQKNHRAPPLLGVCRRLVSCQATGLGRSGDESSSRADTELKATSSAEREACISSQDLAVPNGAASSSSSASHHESPQTAATATGKLEMIVGPMFAGKTSELLRRVQAHEAEGKQVLVVKSGVDNRYSTHEVVTHDGVRKDCYAVSSLSNLQDAIGKKALHEAQVIAIDEAQFFKDLDEFCAEATDARQQTVLVAGLSGDFRRRPFGCINQLLSMADSVTQLTARCNFCSPATPALFTLRVVADDRTELVGGADKYVPVCRHHYNALSGGSHSGHEDQ